MVWENIIKINDSIFPELTMGSLSAGDYLMIYSEPASPVDIALARGRETFGPKRGNNSHGRFPLGLGLD